MKEGIDSLNCESILFFVQKNSLPRVIKKKTIKV